MTTNLIDITDTAYMKRHRKHIREFIQLFCVPIDISCEPEILLDEYNNKTDYIIYKRVYKSKVNNKNRPLYSLIEIVPIGYSAISPIVIRRNYPTIPYCYTKQNGTEFLITSENYQCITIVNLKSRVVRTYGDYEKLKSSLGFCPIELKFDRDSNVLSIRGSYSGSDPTTISIVVSDLNNPDFTNVII